MRLIDYFVYFIS